MLSISLAIDVLREFEKYCSVYRVLQLPWLRLPHEQDLPLSSRRAARCVEESVAALSGVGQIPLPLDPTRRQCALD